MVIYPASNDFLAAVELAVNEGPEILVMHQGPKGDLDQRPLSEIEGGTQVLNVDSRIVVLTTG